MSRPFRAAFLGIDHPHGAGWRELLLGMPGEIEIAALVPGFGDALTSLEETLADRPRFETLDDLLSWGDFDGALVCLDNRATPGVIERLARAGKHVLVEKPGAASEDALDAALQAVDECGVAFQTGYMWRYDEGVGRLREMVQEGRFGKLIHVEMSMVTSDVRRRGPEHYLFDQEVSGRGFFNWLACHFLDLLPYITNDRVTAVTARTGCFGETPVQVDDGGAAILELASGGLATFSGGYWLPRWAGENRWSFRGSRRWVHWFPPQGGCEGSLEIHGPQPQWHAMEDRFPLPPDTTPGYGGANGRALVRDWLRQASGQGQAACRNTTQSTRSTLRLLDAVYASSSNGARVVLPDG